MPDVTFGRKGTTPEQEDRDLFRTYGGPIEIDVTPTFQRPGKYLFLARGFFEGSTEIMVVVSGRRAEETGTLCRALGLLESACQQRAVARRVPPPKADDIRLPVSVKGSWQVRLDSDPEGEDVKVIQLIAARWAFRDGSGQLFQFGEAPAFDLTTRRRNKSYILQTREIDAVPRAPQDGGPSG